MVRVARNTPYKRPTPKQAKLIKIVKLSEAERLAKEAEKKEEMGDGDQGEKPDEKPAPLQVLRPTASKRTKTRFSSMVKLSKGQQTSYAERQKQRMEYKEMKEKERQLAEMQREERIEEARRREQRKKQKEENEKKSMVVQQITNTKKLKKLTPKQMRLVMKM